jgi:toxin ParE1/3/4
MSVRFSPSAKADIQSIYDYIASDNRAAAARVVAAIEVATERLSLSPLSGRLGAVAGTRELVIPRLPYIAVDLAPNFYPALSLLRWLIKPCWAGDAMAISS